MKNIITLILLLLPLFVLGQDSTANDYYSKGMDLYRTEQSHLAIPVLLKSDSLEMAQLNKKSDNYNRSAKQLIICYSDLANFFFKHSNPDLAIEHQIQAINYCKRVYGRKHPEYVTAKKTLAKMKFFFSGKAGADDYYNYGMELKKDHPYDAFSYFQKADTLEKATLNPSSPNYYRSALEIADIKNGMADYWFSIKHYAAAFDYKNDAAEIYKNAFGEESDQYLYSLNELIGFNVHTNNFDEVVRLLTEVAEITKKREGEDSDNYIVVLNNLGFYYGNWGKGNVEEEIKCYKRALELIKKKYGEESPRYIEQLESLAMHCEEVDTTESIRLRVQVMELSKKVYGAESAEYLTALNSLALSYSVIGNDSVAIKYGNEATKIAKKVFGEDNSEYANTLRCIANYYARAAYHGRGDNIDTAIKLQQMAVEIFKKNAVEDEKKDTLYRFCSKYGGSLNLLASYCNIGNYYADAVKYQTLAIEHEIEYRGMPYTDYWWRILADYQLSAKQYDEGAELYKKIYHARISKLVNAFAGLSNDERAKKWNDKYHLDADFFGENLPYASYKCSADNDTVLAGLAFNSIVFSKGFLLNSEFEILNLIEQKGSSDLKERYYKLKKTRASLDSLYHIPTVQRTINADSLAKAITHEEHELTTLALRLGDYIGNLVIDWTEIQKKLKDGDIAIEFANFKDTDERNTYYAAFILKKGMKSPKCVGLFALNDFYDIKTSDYYKTPKLYNLIWKPLTTHLQGVKKVYFSPSGQLHTIGIEYLPDEKGNIFATKYDAYRLSSTRELALEYKPNTLKKAATYGGIQYEFSDDDWRSVVLDKYDQDTIIDIPVISDKYRGSGMAYLDGTRLESEAVATLLRTANYDVAAISDADATEESFKRLSGTGLKILHIGTHGFYESEVDLENAGLQFYTTAQEQTKEDRSLSCSGLLFAGANSALDPRRNKEIPQGVDDGVLTAKEISRLDFRGLDLVVLSACQTGLGEITGDGVFGLQRGFKKAGAQTIVMSLWKVADEPTQLLMIDFFKHLTAGQSKRAAFIAALETVRKKYPNPLYWAAFVMVDGI